jgi:hypothetical protein
MRRVPRVLRYAWASPATAVGLLFSAVAVAAGATPHVVDGVIEVAGGRLHSLLALVPPCGRFGAITFGHVVIGIDHHLLSSIRAHERVHVRQYERWGVFFFPLYVASSVAQLIRGRHPYLDNAFEREAYAKSAARPDA